MQGYDLGVVELGQTLQAGVPITDGSRLPKDPAVLPTYRVYGCQTDDPMPSGSGSLSKLDTGSITGATNATPIVVTSTSHGVTTGTKVVTSGILGNTAGNGEVTATYVDPNRFSLDGSAGNAAYTSGGSFHVAGLYLVTIDVQAGLGYEVGKTYFVLVSWTISGTSYAMMCPFRVV